MTAEYVHTPTITNVVNVFGDIVSSVRAEYDVINNEQPFYLHGHPLEIINTLQEYTNIASLKLKKFPLIALFEDFESTGREGLFLTKAKLNIFIITDTLPTYKASERYVNTFDTVLTPLYNLLIKHMKLSRFIFTPFNKSLGTPINHLYWGKNGLYGNDGNVFNDYVDAIEIKNLDFKVYRN
ncbi:MAG: hypothetical protein WC197_07150 [Candidatus Gastranaerophilaceae bacterium]|jgi:hypothetical protein